jgi:uncharacterized protein YjgD (DUF1641 family)
MAQPLPLRHTVQPDADELKLKTIHSATADHSQAILSSLELLQRLQDNGTLELLRGAASARNEILGQAASLLDTPEAVNALRNLIVLGKALGGVQPDGLKAALEADRVQRSKSPSLWQLFRRARSREARRGLSISIALLEVLGGKQAK